MPKTRKRSDAPAANPSTSAVEGPEPINGNGHNGSHAHDRDRVAQRAYELYQQRGGSHGSDWEDWLAAERELMNAGEQGRSDG